MTLKEKINKDFMEAFKAREMEKKTFLGVVKGEIQNEEGRSGSVSDETVMNILKKIEKSLRQTNTEDSLKELTYIEQYLPKMMDENYIHILVDGMISKGSTNVGEIMKQFNKNYPGQADNKKVSEIAKYRLENNEKVLPL